MGLELRYQAQLPGSPEQVWELLLDPTTLQRCLPGCQRLDAAGEGVFEATLELGVGPVRGSYSGRVTLADLERPGRLRMRVEGGAGPTRVWGEGLVRLEPAEGGTTRVALVGQAQVAGPLAAVGQRLLGSVAQSLVATFFSRLSGELQSRRAAQAQRDTA